MDLFNSYLACIVLTGAGFVSFIIFHSYALLFCFLTITVVAAILYAAQFIAGAIKKEGGVRVG